MKTNMRFFLAIFLSFSFSLSTWAQESTPQPSTAQKSTLTPAEELQARALGQQLYQVYAKIDVFNDYKKGYEYSENAGPATAATIGSMITIGIMPGIMGIIQNGLSSADMKVIAVLAIIVGVVAFYVTKSMGQSEIKKPYQVLLKKMSPDELEAEQQNLKTELESIKAQIAALTQK